MVPVLLVDGDLDADRLHVLREFLRRVDLYGAAAEYEEFDVDLRERLSVFDLEVAVLVIVL